MNSFFREVLEYQHHYNEKLLDEVKDHLGNLPLRTYPVYCHILNAHQTWKARITQTDAFGVLDIHPMESCNDINNKNLDDSKAILDTADLTKSVRYRNSRGDEFANTLHVLNHSTHHKAQIISDFRQASVGPLVTDYIFYKR